MNKLSFFKKSAVAVSLAAGVMVAGQASAGSLAQATLQLSNLLFKNGSASGPTLDASNFSFLSITDSTNLNPSLNGVNNGVSFTTSNGVPLGSHIQCVPSGCPAFLNPATPYANAPIPAAGNGSLAASNLVGAPITGLGAPGPAIPTPATAQTAALSELTSTGFADSASVLRLQTAFTFSLATSTTVAIDFDTIVHAIADLNIETGSSQSSTAWNIIIVNNTTGATVFNWTPDGVLGTGITGGTEIADDCNMQATAGLFTTVGTSEFNCSGHETALTPLLAAGTRYTLTLRHETDSSVTLVVPEPESILLMGLGLAGLALTQRRRQVRKS